jgi:hypothetical protein
MKELDKMTAAEMRAAAEYKLELAKKETAQAQEMLAQTRKLEREEAQAKERAENAAHYAKMFEEQSGVSGLNEAQHGIVYSLAWEQGHSSGFSEVEFYYGEFAEMARKVLDAR